MILAVFVAVILILLVISMSVTAIMNNHFDNLLLYYETDQIDIVTTTVVTAQIDLEIPRGYIAKIRKVAFKWSFYLTSALNDGDDVEWQTDAVLLRDPDDITTVLVAGNVSNDVIASSQINGITNAAAAGQVARWGHEDKYDFLEPLDQIVVRPMRFNGVAKTGDCDILCKCKIWYTLERIPDNKATRILSELLGIL